MITIYVGTYNLAGIISQIIRGLKLQGYPVVFIDNSSIDETVNIIQQEFPQARIFKTEHSTIHKRINMNAWHKVAVEDCQTPYIFMLDGDIVLPQHAVNKALALFTDDVGCVAIEYDKADHIQVGAALYKTDIIKGSNFDVINECWCLVNKKYFDDINKTIISLSIPGVQHLRGRNMVEVQKVADGYQISQTMTVKVTKAQVEQRLAMLKKQRDMISTQIAEQEEVLSKMV